MTRPEELPRGILSGFSTYTMDLDATIKRALRAAKVPGRQLVSEMLAIDIEYLLDKLSEAASKDQAREAARTFIANKVFIPTAHQAHESASPFATIEAERRVNAFFRWLQISMNANGMPS